MQKNQIVDYRKFRFSKLRTPEFKHLLYLIYWPIYGLMFQTLEQFWIRDSYYTIECSFDKAIPFCEYFLIPYLFWFVFLVGIHFYTLLWDVSSFKKLMQFIMITYTVTILIYILFPNQQELRPETFVRDNIFTRFLDGFYKFDTNTNVIGSVAVLLSAWNSKHFSTPLWRFAFTVVALLISMSTVFLKQHSILDVIAAIPLCLVAGYIVYRKKESTPQSETAEEEVLSC